MLRLLTATFFLSVWCWSRTEAYNTSAMQLLSQKLLKDYDKNVLPSAEGKGVDIVVGASIVNFDLNEQTHELSLDFWIKLFWNDPRMTWDAEENAGIETVYFDSTHMWCPDLTLYTSSDWKNSKLTNGNTKIVVRHSGEIIYVPPAAVKVQCTIDVMLWPYDQHTCKVKFGSWVYDGYMMNLKKADPPLSLELDDMIRDWKLSNYSLSINTKHYECCPEPYVDATIYLTLRRAAPTFCWTVMMPTAVLCLLTFVTFLLPPASGEKIVVALLSLLANICFLDYVTKVIGHAPTHTPILVKVVCLQLVLLVLAVLLNALVLNISRGPHTLALSSSLKLPLIRLSSLLGLASYAHKVSRSDGADLEKSDRLELGEESKLCSGESRPRCNCDTEDNLWNWLLLGAVIDRLCLFIYLIIIVLSICIFSTVA
ncbi:acetylcholine receptor subunit alpha-like 1 [Oratosquilla oratoria]|uniref:acetylcholine receptor subunit alpha-like 1 n=1 Tax=Oratosquilla oratoria TaxID=337810 RepID=UPI003F764144